MLALATGLLLPPNPNWIGGVGMGAFGLLTFIGAWRLRPALLKVFERGVSIRRTWSSEVIIRDDQVERFSFGQTDVFTNGVYAGTLVVFSLVAEGGGVHRFNLETRKEDLELSAFRDRLADVLARRLLAQIDDGHGVEWGPARIERNGLQVKSDFGLPQLIAFSELRFLFNRGELTLDDGHGNRLLSMQTSVENFFPCFAAVSVLAERESSSPAVSA